MTKFSMGEVVVLKCGGPRMVIVCPEQDEDDWVVCSWHQTNGRPRTRGYPVESLTRVEALQ
jgi:uncharacterized protein YodC (DUF2158 family)